MTPDDRLKAALALGADQPPSEDLAFTARVMERVARRRFALGMLTLAVWAAVAGLVLWVLRPAVERASGTLEGLAGPAATAAGLVLVALVLVRLDPAMLARLPGRMLPFRR